MTSRTQEGHKNVPIMLRYPKGNEVPAAKTSHLAPRENMGLSASVMLLTRI